MTSTKSKAMAIILALVGPILFSLRAETMTKAQVEAVLAQASTRAVAVAPDSVIAVADRNGHVLAVWDVNGGGAPSDTAVAVAISKAGTAAFLSSNRHAFSTRTAGFIVQPNFPPGIQNRPPGPLVGVPFSSLPFSDVNRFSAPGGGFILGTSLAGAPGGVPLYAGGVLIGGVGVTVDGMELPQVAQTPDVHEDVALAGQIGFEPDEKLGGRNVFIDGIAVAYLETPSPSIASPLTMTGNAVAPYSPRKSPDPISYGSLAGVAGEVRAEIKADPEAGDIRGQARLTKAEVESILRKAAARALTTRAGIRLPRGQPARVFIAVVSNPDAAGTGPKILGTFRTPDATIFSWDVAVQKARTAVFFSSDTRAFSTRTVGFLAQDTFPPGIVNTLPGPFFELQERFSGLVGVNPINGAMGLSAPPASLPPNPNLPNGITIFPGGFPLYRNGVLIGAIGVSGDGVDQDDIIAASGAEDFLAPEAIRADRFSYRGARLPYAKFPRNPAL